MAHDIKAEELLNLVVNQTGERGYQDEVLGDFIHDKLMRDGQDMREIDPADIDQIGENLLDSLDKAGYVIVRKEQK